MKPKEILYLLGFRPKARAYDCEVSDICLPRDGPIRYARWLHPCQSSQKVSQAAVDELRSFLHPGDVAIDIGAHTGDSTLPIALAVGPTGCVLALEPNSYVFPILEKNADLNRDKTNIVPLMFAATPDDGEFDFEYSDPGFCNGGLHDGISRWRHAHAFKLRVKGRNLDVFLRAEYPDLIGRIRYVKVDAEGFDHAVLRSLERLITDNKPFIKAEVFKHTDRPQREALAGFLLDLGYSIHHIVGETCYRGERIGPGDMMRWRHFDVFCVPQSVEAGIGRSDTQSTVQQTGGGRPEHG